MGAGVALSRPLPWSPTAVSGRNWPGPTGSPSSAGPTSSTTRPPWCRSRTASRKRPAPATSAITLADILEVDEDIELHTGDMEKLEASSVMELATSDIDVSDLTDETPNPDHVRSRARAYGSVPPKTEKTRRAARPSCSPRRRRSRQAPALRLRRRRRPASIRRAIPTSRSSRSKRRSGAGAAHRQGAEAAARRVPVGEVGRLAHRQVGGGGAAVGHSQGRRQDRPAHRCRASRSRKAAAGRRRGREPPAVVGRRHARLARDAHLADLRRPAQRGAARRAHVGRRARAAPASATRWCRWTARLRWCASGQVALGQFAEAALAAERKAAARARRRRPSGTARQERAQAAQRGRPAHPRRRAEPGHVRGRRRRRDRRRRPANHDTLACYTATPAVVITIQRGARRPVEAHLSVHGRPLPPRLDGRARQGRSHRRRQVRGRRLLHPPRPVGVDDAARAQDRRLHRVQGAARRRARSATASSASPSTAASSATSTSSTPATPAPTSAASIPATSTRSRSTSQRKEVLIKEDACTGCTLCATACPYNAIEMHELDDAPLLKLRLNKEGKLGFGDGDAAQGQAAPHGLQVRPLRVLRGPGVHHAPARRARWSRSCRRTR